MWNVSVWRFQVCSALQWEWEDESLENPTWLIWCYSRSHKYAVLPLHYCLNWDNSGGSSLARRTRCCPLPERWQSWYTAFVFASSLFFPSFNTAKPTCGTHWTPSGGAEVHGGEGESRSSPGQNSHQDQGDLSLSWDYTTMPTDTMQKAVLFPHWQYNKSCLY